MLFVKMLSLASVSPYLSPACSSTADQLVAHPQINRLEGFGNQFVGCPAPKDWTAPTDFTGKCTYWTSEL